METDERIRETTQNEAFWVMCISDMQSVAVIDMARTEDAMALAVNLVG